MEKAKTTQNVFKKKCVNRIANQFLLQNYIFFSNLFGLLEKNI